ncbi:MAG: hypothetical protein V3S25_09415 [Nitrospirales bacterium]
MTPTSPRETSSSPLAAALSTLIPGLGQASRGRLGQAGLVLLATVVLLGCTVALGRIQDRAAEIFFFMIVVLPWWVIQSYDAFLPKTGNAQGFGHTLRVIWARAHDVRYLGALFLLSAFFDGYIIFTNPTYTLPFFCNKPSGLLGFLAKAQSPTLHTIIGYGFLRLRRWSLFVYLAYAGFGLLNATVNYACFGFGRIRTVLVVTLLIFTAYVLWRRHCFFPPLPASQDDHPGSHRGALTA